MNNRPLDPDEMNDAQRTAWQNSWTPDEALVAHFPPGYWTHLILIACLKRWLMADNLPVGDRVEYLEHLNRMIWGLITAEAVAVVEPGNDTFMAIFYEAMKLDEGHPDGRCPAAFKLLSRWSVFWDLLRLNPSMLKAIKVCRGCA